MSMIIQEEFELDTQIITEIKWKTPAKNEEHENGRKIFEKNVQEFANFLNENLGNVILDSIKSIEILNKASAN